MEKLQMRKLQAQDITRIVDLINNLDIVNTIKDLFSGKLRGIVLGRSEEGGKLNNEELGLEVFMDFLPQLFVTVPKAQSEVNLFLSELCGVEQEKIDTLDIEEYFALFVDFFKKPELGALMKVAQKYLQ